MTNRQWDTLWINGQIVTCETPGHILKNAALAVKDGRIAWTGSLSALTDRPDLLATDVHDLLGNCLTPGLIDCHTHLVYAGNRSSEFEKRLNGLSYADIANAGGGIQSTVMATRAATEDNLFEQSLVRAKALQQSGVTTLEIKSGYGLEWDTEAKILRVAERIGKTLSLTVKRTFLGAHAVPAEFQGDAQGYVNYVCGEMIPKIAQTGLADAVDVFCETIAFTLQQTEQVFKAAQQYQLGIKCHAEQLSCMKSPELAARYRALSVDHLEYASEAGIRAMAAAGTTAVLLPTAWYFLRESQMPPLSLLREHKVAIALASDCNPGTSPVMSLQPVMNMACLLFRMTPAEVWQGVTLHAAKALGLEATHGSLTVGKVADLAIWRMKSPAELCYHLGDQPLIALYKAGNRVL